jgi:hypothetical protein
VERNVKSTRAKPVEAAMVARAAFGSLLIAAPAALIVTLVSLAFLLRGRPTPRRPCWRWTKGKSPDTAACRCPSRGPARPSI